jgi:hypothetical protein
MAAPQAAEVAEQPVAGPGRQAAARSLVVTLLAAALTAYVLVEVNMPLLPPLAELAVFGGLGLVLAFLGPAAAGEPAAGRSSGDRLFDWRWLDWRWLDWR